MLKITVPVECEIQPWEIDVQPLLEKYPVLLKACAIRALNGRSAGGGSLQQVAELIDRVNPRFPTDSFSVSTLASLLDYCISPEEIDILEEVMPEYSGDRSIKVVASESGIVLTFSHSMKHSGMYYTVDISSDKPFCYPYTVCLTTYADMDDLRNHFLWQNPVDEDSQDLCESGDCDCGADVAFTGELVIEDDFDADKVRAWIEENLFKGQQEDEDENI